MKPVMLEAMAAEQGCRHVVFAKDQPQYEPLPALVFEDGKILTEWELTEDERARLIAGERVRLWVWTFNKPLQPIALEITSETSG